MAALIRQTNSNSGYELVRYNLRNKRASKEKKTVTGKNRSLAQPQTLTQGGHEIASLLNSNEQNFFISTYDEINTDKLGK